MSQIKVTEDKRVCDLLPPAVVSFVNLPAKPPTNVVDWTCIHPAHIQEFIRVLPRPNNHLSVLPYAVVYAPEVYPGSTDFKTVSVGLQLYGYIASARVGEHGNWDMTERGIPRALWNLRIVGGPLAEVFRQQADALWDIEQFIIASIRGHGLSVADEEKGRAHFRKSIFIAQRVFHKVRNGKPEKNLAKGLAAQYDRKWRIPEVPQFGERLQDGTIRPYRQERFRRGDFVQVSVQFDTQSSLPPSGDDVVVRLLLRQLILLVPAADTGAGKIIPGLEIRGEKKEDRREVAVDKAPAFQQMF
ncbi:hypothetical protein K488DRAFT_73392 [Vararia minispora EC-137]|uniref:Uncharacterized protein n=1 Tax=Vararia minispora EC-137 TaxID=1314806 RepID=A0ACB8QAT7_9AGAM|nr:hypothetical protein K488DRAFT_73392 [Vararia minispora EC-137]